MSFTLHHIVPLKMLLLTGGDPYDYDNLTPAHRTCNSAHRDGDEIKQVIIVSRQW